MKLTIVLCIVLAAVVLPRDITVDELYTIEFRFSQLVDGTLGGTYPAMKQGDMVTINWTQPLRTIPYVDQVDPVNLGDTVTSFSFPVSASNVTMVDSAAVFTYSGNQLVEGEWQVQIRSSIRYTDGETYTEMFSKYSTPAGFFVEMPDDPPDVPLQIIIKFE